MALNAIPSEVSIEIFSSALSQHGINLISREQPTRGHNLNSKHMTEDTGGKSHWKLWGKDTTSLPWAKGWQETDPASQLCASHAPISTYRSVVAQSFHSLPCQLALPSSSSSRRGGLKGLHVRNKKGGGAWKVESSRTSYRNLTLEHWSLFSSHSAVTSTYILKTKLP